MARVEKILWRALQPGDYFNIEKPPNPGEPRGQLHIDMPNSVAIAEFLGVQLVEDKEEEFVLPVRTIGAPDTVSDLTLKKRPNGRWFIPRQNYQEGSTDRHPAWEPPHGWPRSTTAAASTEAASTYLQSLGGIHLYIARTTDGDYYAGLTVGNTLPNDWPEVCRPLFEGGKGGAKSVDLITPGGGVNLSPLSVQILDAFHENKSVLLYGPPGTGKTYAVAEVYRYLQGGSGSLSAIDLNAHDPSSPFTEISAPSPFPEPTIADWVTFYQDYGFEDFMVGLRPTAKGELEPVAGRLLDMALEVGADTAKSGVMFVDEINRGNVAKIFGNLLTYMDDDYREDGLCTVPVRLPKIQGDPTDASLTEPVLRASGKREPISLPWLFPTHIYLLATMNSVDRAVVPLDTALGRRFERIDVMPDLLGLASHLQVSMGDVDLLLMTSEKYRTPIDTEDGGEEDDETDLSDLGSTDDGSVAPSDAEETPDWNPRVASVALLRYLNDEVAETLGLDYEIGHVYFLNVETWADLTRVWDRKIWPQLRDRFGARPDNLGKILRVAATKPPNGYPFKRRRSAGRALEIAPMRGLDDAKASEVFKFLCTGHR